MRPLSDTVQRENADSRRVVPVVPRRAWAPRIESTAFIASIVAASVGLWLALTASPYFVTNDGPQHIMMGHIENVYEGENPIYRHFLAPAPQYASRGFSALFVPLDSFLPWRTAYRLTVFAILLAWSWGFVALVHAIDARRRWLGLLGFATAFQWTVYMGFFAFVSGTACGLFVIAFAISRERIRPTDVVITSLGLLLTAFLHVFAALLTALVVAAVFLGRSASWRERLRIGAGFGMACLPLLVLFIATLIHQGRLVETQPHGHLTQPLLLRLRYLHRCFQPGANLRGVLMMSLAAVGLLRAASRARRSSRVPIALLAVSIGYLAAGACAPNDIPGWYLFSQRFLPLGVMLAISQIDLERLGRPSRAMAGLLCAVVTAAMLHGAAGMNRKLYERGADVYAALDAPVHRSGLRLPVIRDSWNSIAAGESPVPWMVPMHSVYGLSFQHSGIRSLEFT